MTAQLPQHGEWWVKKPCAKPLCATGWSLGATWEPVQIDKTKNLAWGTVQQVKCGCLYRVTQEDKS